MNKIITLLVLLAGALSACSDNVEDNTEAVSTSIEASEETQAESSRGGVIPQSQLQALEGAAAVSDVLEQAEEARRRQLQ